MKTILLIRRKKDYYLTSNTSDWYSEYMTNEWDTNKKIQWWNHLFSISFLEMRKELNKIAFSDIDALGFDFVFDHISDQTVSDILKIKNAWFVPVDDDDWIDMNLSTKLRSTDIDHNMCYWNTLFLRCWGDYEDLCEGDYRSYKKKDDGVMLPSCCYAVNSDMLTHSSFWQIIDHGWTMNKKGLFLENIESVYVKTPVSSYTMKEKIKKEKDMLSMVNRIKNIDINISDQFKNKLILLKELFLNCKVKKFL